jgi:hypothetical protein
MKVSRGEICGSTAKAVSPTRPRVTLLTAEVSTGRWRYGATIYISLLDDVEAFFGG